MAETKRNGNANPHYTIEPNECENTYFCCRFNAQSMHNIYLTIKATGEAIKVHSILYLCMFYLRECVLQMAFDREYCHRESERMKRNIHNRHIQHTHKHGARVCAYKIAHITHHTRRHCTQSAVSLMIIAGVLHQYFSVNVCM